MTSQEFDRFVEPVDPALLVVTTRAGEERNGCVVGFSTQCSIDPPRFLVCLSVNNHTEHLARRAEGLAVHLLRPGDHDLVELFGGQTGDEVDKMSACRWKDGPLGLPLLESCDRWFAGRIEERYDLGDHVGYLLVPVEVSVGPDGPCLRLSHSPDVAPGHPAGQEDAADDNDGDGKPSSPTGTRR